MKSRNFFAKIISIVLTASIIFSAAAPSASAASILSKEDREVYRLSVCDEIVNVAREQIGFYESNINEFITWYYGYDTDAYWCSIFVSWCADQVGSIGTAVPKRAACSSMKSWFDRRGEYYSVDSGYIPEKGDIVFINTAVDGTDSIHHVEIITENGFLGNENNPKIKCIGGNTSNLEYSGSEYVTEKIRPVDGPRAQIVGYAHPSYEKSMGIRGSFNTFAEKNRLPFFKFLHSKIISLIYNIELFWANLTMSVETSVQNTTDKLNKSRDKFNEKLNSLKIKDEPVSTEDAISAEETTQIV